MKKNNNKWLLWGLIGFTVILLATAIVLFFQLKQPTKTTTPSPQPRASIKPQAPSIKQATGEGVCELSFTVTASPSPSPSVSPSPSPSSSPTPNACFDTCSTDDECKVTNSSWRCMTVSGDKRCVNPSCTNETDCTCTEDKKACWDKCQNDNDCESSWRCMTIPNTNDKRCVNAACISETDCSCNASPSPTPITYASPSPVVVAQTKGGQPVLPQAGNNTAAVLGVSTGILLILGALLF